MKKHHLHHAIFLATIITGTLSLTACDKVAEKATEKVLEEALDSETVDIDTSDDSFSIKTDKGTISSSDGINMTTDADGNVTFQSGDNIKIPDDFPKDIPIPNKFIMESELKLDSTFSLIGEVNDSVESLEENLKPRLAKQGWSNYIRVPGSDSISIRVSKDNRNLTYGFEISSGGYLYGVISVDKKAD